MPKKGHKWTEEQKIARSHNYSGGGNPFYGKKHTKQSRAIISKFRKGVWNGFGFKKGMVPWNKGKPHSDETKRKLSEKAKQQWRDGRASREFLFRGGEAHKCWLGGISKKEYRQRQREELAGRIKPKNCESCGREGRIYFDHDHKTGVFRGWICSQCNCALGLVGDDTERLFKLINYLESWRSKIVKSVRVQDS